jgi:predicted metal-binding protein
MIEGTFVHVAKTGKRYEIKYKANIVPVSEIPYYPEIRELCVGCPNYGKKLSCPPIAKEFPTISRNYSHMLVLAFIVDVEQEMNQRIKKSFFYSYLRALDWITSRLIEKTARNLEKELNGYALLEGACKLCVHCNYKKEGLCKRPRDVRPSLEATGVDVSGLVRGVLNHTIQWRTKYSRVPEKFLKFIPEETIFKDRDYRMKYLTKVVGILINQNKNHFFLSFLPLLSPPESVSTWKS